MESNIQYNLPEIAELYVQDKAGIISLMVDKYGIPMDRAMVTHAELISQLKKLYEESEDFRNDLINLMQENEIISQYNNSAGAIIAAAIAAAGGAVSSVTDVQKAKIESQAQNDKFFQDYIMGRQGQNNAGKVILISGISLVVVGFTAWLILRKR